MNWLDSHTGALLELCSDAKPRGMVVLDRTRLNDRLRHFHLKLIGYLVILAGMTYGLFCFCVGVVDYQHTNSQRHSHDYPI